MLFENNSSVICCPKSFDLKVKTLTGLLLSFSGTE